MDNIEKLYKIYKAHVTSDESKARMMEIIKSAGNDAKIMKEKLSSFTQVNAPNISKNIYDKSKNTQNNQSNGDNKERN